MGDNNAVGDFVALLRRRLLGVVQGSSTLMYTKVVGAQPSVWVSFDQHGKQ
jgi:hypothetical protein